MLRVVLSRPGARVPSYATAGAAGLDLSACLGDDSAIIEPGEIVKVPIGIRIAIEDGFEGQVRPRSGLASRHGVTLPNAPGTIDCDYRGEVFVPLINLGVSAFTVEDGMRVAQLVIAPVVQVAVVQEAGLDATNRGAGGFGSTGL
mgnify:CR=1 FL=1